jgi:hypothetical protein
MGAKKDPIVLKWYHFRRIEWTREYLGGNLSGFGLGVIIMAYANHEQLIPDDWFWPVLILAGALSSLGQFIALHAQGRYISAPKEKQ